MSSIDQSWLSTLKQAAQIRNSNSQLRQDTNLWLDDSMPLQVWPPAMSGVTAQPLVLPSVSSAPVSKVPLMKKQMLLQIDPCIPVNRNWAASMDMSPHTTYSMQGSPSPVASCSASYSLSHSHSGDVVVTTPTPQSSAKKSRAKKKVGYAWPTQDVASSKKCGGKRKLTHLVGNATPASPAKTLDITVPQFGKTLKELQSFLNPSLISTRIRATSKIHKASASGRDSPSASKRQHLMTSSQYVGESDCRPSTHLGGGSLGSDVSDLDRSSASSPSFSTAQDFMPQFYSEVNDYNFSEFSAEDDRKFGIATCTSSDMLSHSEIYDFCSLETPMARNEGTFLSQKEEIADCEQSSLWGFADMLSDDWEESL